MSAVEKAVNLMKNLGSFDERCPVCAGGWFYESSGECVGAVHHPECPRRDDEPPVSAQPGERP